jgi:Putative metallopeptidase
MRKASCRSLSNVSAVAVVLAAGLWTVATARADGDSSVGAPVQESPATQQVAPAAPEEKAAPAAPEEKAAPAAKEELGRIHIEYVPPKKPALQKTFEEVKNRHVLERTQEIFSPFRLSADLYIKAVECDGRPNTFFDHEEERPTVKLCYEYLKAIHDKMPKKPTKAGITPRQVMVGQFMFAAAHEMGHALFEIYNIPIFGRQEDAADQFATYYILQFGGDRARRLILGAAYAYAGFVKPLTGTPKVTLPLAAFSSDHGQPEQRFYNLVCIAYGYDPKIFAAVVERGYLPETRAKVCKYEYSNLRYAIKTLIGPHIDEELAKKVVAIHWFTPPDAREPDGWVP